MNKAFIPSEWEEKLYSFWEKKGYFAAKADKNKEAFSIVLPPPNANAPLHVGHAMYVYEDIMIRYNKLLGKEVLWLPGADHAGFETQFVFEKHLAKQGKSRFDYDRKTLFKMIWDFVMANRPIMENQLRRLGFALDWSQKKFTMDEDIVKIVYATFKKLFDDGLLYRDVKLVNYSPYDGTAFSDLEVDYEEREDDIWYINYPLKDGSGAVTVATTRPETMLGDTAVAVHPSDKRYKKLVGQTIILPLMNREIPIVADDVIDLEFGTGAVKVTPAHDHTDWEIRQRHNLQLIQVIGFDNKMTAEAGEFAGLRVKEAREKVLQKLTDAGLLVKQEKITHRVPVQNKSRQIIQPLPKEQWFIKVKPLVDESIARIKQGEIKIYPKRFQSILIDWLERFHDWNISRQTVWGISIPAWKCADCGEWIITDGETPAKCSKCASANLTQDEDTFDTWFSSAQWPFATLKTAKDPALYDYFYPTTVMETGYDILPWWVARMIMMGIYATGKVPFQNVYLHGMVRDAKGRKMSKSKGNVVNPMPIVDKYGADALRGALLFQTASGGDVNFSEDKALAMRNFANKIWNIGRFIQLGRKTEPKKSLGTADKMLTELAKEFASLQKSYSKNMTAYEFSRVFDELYEFLWHRFADYYIEQLKEVTLSGNIKVLESLEDVYFQVIVMLHPFMPFVTEAVWKESHGDDSSILDYAKTNLSA